MNGIDQPVKRNRFRHLPPTAVPIRVEDFRQGIAAFIHPAEKLDGFKQQIKAYTGSQHCFLVSSGRAALTLILAALRRCSDRSQVVIPAYTCPTVVQSVLKAGLMPVPCDVSPHTLDLDREGLQRLLSQPPLAILSTHLYGLAQDVCDLMPICQERDIFLVEDAAQSLGARMGEKMVGTSGEAGFYSLGRGKSLPAGNGGVVVAKERLASLLSEATFSLAPAPGRSNPSVLAALLGYSIATRPATWWFIARSSLNPASDGMDATRLPSVELHALPAAVAGIASALLARLDQIHAIRRRNAHRIMEMLAGFDFVQFPHLPPASQPVFLRLPIVLDHEEIANRLFQFLHQSGIGVSRSYYRTLPDLFPSQFGTPSSGYPGAEKLANCLLTLPTHPFLVEEDFHRILNAFQASDRRLQNARQTT